MRAVTMQALRPALWRQARRATRFAPQLQRSQHNQYGPHKEYFQTPGQMPAPDTTPYTAPYTPQVVKTPTATGPSLFSRFYRSVFWATLFSTLGLIAGTALISWEYIQPPFEPGSEEEQDLFEEILDTMESHPLVLSLRHDNWIEDNFYAGRVNGALGGQNLVGEKLTGPRGITMKAFRHPSQPITMMVFFLGFGIEGWPDVIHGGVITTLLKESVYQHLENHHRDLGTITAEVFDVTFKKPMRPGDIYSILVPHADVSDIPNDEDPEAKMVHVTPIILHIDQPVRIELTDVPSGLPQPPAAGEVLHTTGGQPVFGEAQKAAIPNLHAGAEVFVMMRPNVTDAAVGQDDVD
ncbi:hypothetical protein, variant [Exophiala sideris]|uniref:Thioesterase domain-containing protein n=1 Tax=Exophiala sideris TaxID=1016849 RepID=A0A0D1ZE92_9EURO|nr:hypothetical protein PV11_00867 [Exophiala sideris]KIV85133.1 hypothetical protein, variant [Exophiala sideris]